MDVRSFLWYVEELTYKDKTLSQVDQSEFMYI